MRIFPAAISDARQKFLAFFSAILLIFSSLLVPGGLNLQPVQAANLTVVTSNADSGTNTLRAAITSATSNASATTITFNLSGSQTITLASTLTIGNSSTNPITIDGGTKVILDGNNAVQVFSINAGSVTTLQNMTIQMVMQMLAVVVPLQTAGC